MPDRNPPNRRLGLMLLLGGTFCLSLIPVVSKVILQSLPRAHFTPLWMAASTVWAALWVFRRGFRPVAKSVAVRWKALLLVGFLAAGWVYLYFYGVERLDPAVATFLMNSRIVWGVVLAYLLFRETPGLGEGAGIAAVVAGVVLVFGRPGGVSDSGGMLAILGAAVFFVLVNAVIKGQIPREDVPLALLARFVIPGLVFAVIVFASGTPFPALSPRTIWTIAIGSLVGPFLSFLLIYSAIPHLPLGVHTVFQSVGIVFTTIISFLVFGEAPPAVQLIGGAAIVVGLIVIGVSSGNRTTTDSRPPIRH